MHLHNCLYRIKNPPTHTPALSNQTYVTRNTSAITSTGTGILSFTRKKLEICLVLSVNRQNDVSAYSKWTNTLIMSINFLIFPVKEVLLCLPIQNCILRKIRMFSEKKNYVLQCCGAKANQSPSFLDIINGMIKAQPVGKISNT